MAAKQYRLAADRIRPLATGRGSCVASDRITVDGHGVGFMYRERPDGDNDSGWRFFAGHESQEFMDDPGNFAIHDLNTIANYDPDVIPLLDSPWGSAFGRPGGKGEFTREEDFPMPEGT